MKSLLYVDESFHSKTRSTDFLVQLFKERFVVDTAWIRDGNWRERNLEERISRGKYDSVVFFQTYPFSRLNRLECKNVTYVPMYDSVSLDDRSFWRNLSGIKIVCFSRKMASRVAAIGLENLSVQYFPEPMKQERLEPHPTDGLFFWQRRPDIDWKMVKLLVGAGTVGPVHIHRAMDPNQEYVAPSEVEEKAYNIRYSHWFETPQDYLNALAKYKYFVAPRRKEGIGNSFLEAMAMGRVVIAAKDSTMDEYLVDGVTGYLFDPDNPSMIDISQASRIGTQAAASIADGWKHWQERRYSILDFVEAQPRAHFHFTRRSRRIKLVRLARRIAWGLMPYGLVKLLQK